MCFLSAATRSAFDAMQSALDGDGDGDGDDDDDDDDLAMAAPDATAKVAPGHT